MNLEELERLAREASEEAEGDWFCPDLIESKMPILSTRKARRLMAACSPETVLRLVSIAKAAGAVADDERPAELLGKDIAALRAALIPPGCKPT